MWEIAFLAVLALLIFGPDKLPGIAKSVGKTISAVRREARSTMDELKRSADLQELREAAGELRGTTEELKRTASLTPEPAGATAAGDLEAARARAAELAVPTAPAPFDPDAT